MRPIFTKHHAQLPTVLPLADRLRIFYSTKTDNRSTVRAFDVDPDDPTKVIEQDRPVLDLGPRGHFDDSGVMPSCVIKEGGKYRLYYTGWHLRQSVPYSHGIGIASSEDGFHFQKEGLVFGVNHLDHFLVNSGVVTDHVMYYCSGNGWDGDFPTYHIALAMRTAHGWVATGHKVVGEPGEAISRVGVQGDRIWFAAKRKNTPYHIEYLEDGKRHARIRGAYPCFHGDYVFFNIDYGESGIWCTKWNEWI